MLLDSTGCVNSRICESMCASVLSNNHERFCRLWISPIQVSSNFMHTSGMTVAEFTDRTLIDCYWHRFADRKCKGRYLIYMIWCLTSISNCVFCTAWVFSSRWVRRTSYHAGSCFAITEMKMVASSFMLSHSAFARAGDVPSTQEGCSHH